MQNKSTNNFIEVFDNVFSKEDCKKIIDHFILVKNQKIVHNRQQEDANFLKTKKDTESYIISNLSLPASDSIVNPDLLEIDKWIYNRFLNTISCCFNEYADRYKILQNKNFAVSPVVKIQKTTPGQGYHIWHCERGTVNHRSRLMLAILYLNDVEHGGETELLYQSIRINPKQGRLIFCPGDFTHTHRGNQPLESEKYILNTWIEFTN